MGTVSQELTRIQGGKSSIRTSTNAKLQSQGIEIPENATIDEYSAYIDQIQTGGGAENDFLKSTDISHVFQEKRNNVKAIAGIKRFSQNSITNLNYTFDHFEDYGYDSEAGENIDAANDYIQTMIRNNPNASKDHILGSYCNIDSNQPPKTIDLTGVVLGGNCNYAFYNIGQTAVGNDNLLTIKVDKDTFKNATNVDYLFANITRSKVIIVGKRLNLSSSISEIFKNTQGTRLIDEDGNIIKNLTIGLYNNNDIRLYYFADFASSYKRLERVNFDIHNAKITSATYMFAGYYGSASNPSPLKSITGLDLSNCTSLSYFFQEATGTNYRYTQLGELGIVTGSTLRTNFNIKNIWYGTKDTVIDGQTVEYWYEKFANALGQKTVTSNVTITINTTLYNSLTQAQIELITDKGYNLAYAS